MDGRFRHPPAYRRLHAARFLLEDRPVGGVHPILAEFDADRIRLAATRHHPGFAPKTGAGLALGLGQDVGLDAFRFGAAADAHLCGDAHHRVADQLLIGQRAGLQRAGRRGSHRGAGQQRGQVGSGKESFHQQWQVNEPGADCIALRHFYGVTWNVPVCAGLTCLANAAATPVCCPCFAPTGIELAFKPFVYK